MMFDIGTLAGFIELTDRFSPTSVSVQKEIDKLEDKIGGLKTKLGELDKGQPAGGFANMKSGVSGLIESFGSLKTVAASLGVGLIAKEFLDVTGNLADMSAQTDVSTTSLQRWDYAGKLVGVSLDTVTTAVGMLQKRLSEGEISITALDRLNLNLEDLKAKRPEEQFEAIAAAISKIENPSDRAATAMEIFGRGGVKLLPLLRTNLKEVGDAAERLNIVLGEDVISTGDRVGDMFTTVMGMGKGLLFTAISPLFKGILELTDGFVSLGDAESSTNATLENFGLNVGEAVDQVKDLARWIGIVATASKDLELPTIRPPSSVTANAASIKNPFAAMLGEQKMSADELSDVYRNLDNALDASRKRMTEGEQAAKKLRDAHESIRMAMIPLTAQQQLAVIANEKLNVSHSATAVVLRVSEAAISSYLERVKNFEEMQKEQAELFEFMKKATKKLGSELIAQDEAQRLRIAETLAQGLQTQLSLREEYGENLLQLGMNEQGRELRSLQLHRQKVLADLGTRFGAENTLYDQAKKNIEDYFDALEDRLTTTKIATESYIETFRGVAFAIQDIAQSVGDDTFFGRQIGNINHLAQAWNHAVGSIEAYENARTNGERAQAIGGAIANGVQATGSGGIANRVIGGGVAGAPFGITGIAIGATVGLIRGLADRAKENAEANKSIRALQDSLVDTYGTMDSAERHAGVLGITLRSATGYHGVAGAEALQKAMTELEKKTQELNSAAERYELTWLDLGEAARSARVEDVTRGLLDDYKALTKAGADPTKVIKGMGGALSQLVVDAVSSGQKIPVALEPILQSLIRQKLLTEDASRAMLGMAEETKPSLAEIEDAASRYGLKIEDLGNSVKQIRITEIASQVVKDWELLSSAGADAGVVMRGMAAQVQEAVTAAITVGTQLPESMRPLIEQMIDAGLLTDEFGNKLVDTSRIDFVKPLAELVDSLLQKLDELIDRFSAVGTAAEVAGRRARGSAETIGTAVPRGSVSSEADDIGNARDGGTVLPSGRVLPFRASGTDTIPVMTSPGEVIINTGQQRGVSNALAATAVPRGGTNTFILEIDRQVYAEISLPAIADETKRLRLA